MDSYMDKGIANIFRIPFYCQNQWNKYEIELHYNHTNVKCMIIKRASGVRTWCSQKKKKV